MLIMNMKKNNLILAAIFLTVFSACGQTPSKGRAVSGSSEDVKTFPKRSPIPTGKTYCHRMPMILW